MTIAVIMSVYANDHPTYLKDALKSLLGQSLHIDAIHIGIDGPIPHELTASIAEATQANHNIRIHAFSRNRGLAAVLNDLIDAALSDPNCEFLFRMDADDISIPNRMEKQVAYMREHPNIGIAGSWAWTLGESSKVGVDMRKSSSSATLKARLPIDSPFIHPTVVFRASVLRAGNRYPTDTVRFEDLAFWAKLAKVGYQFGNMPEHLLHYRFTLETAARRAGLEKTMRELGVRLGYCLSYQPWRLDILSLALALTISKLIFPAAVRARLFALRAKMLSH